MSSYWIRVSPKSNKNVLVRDRKGHTDMRRPRGDGSIVWSDAATSHRTPGATRSCRGRKGSSLELPERARLY